MNRAFLLFKGITFLLFLSLFATWSYSQCTSSNARNAATAASVSFTGSRFGYDIPNNALAADNVYATASAILSVLSGPTQNLTLTNFGFSIPAGATICGVIATVKKKAANVNILSTVSDNSVKLVKGGIVSGTNKALVGNWTTTNTSFAYGGDMDTWGLTLTPADVNASNFGIAFSASIAGTISLIPSAQIDQMQLTVYYSIGTLPVLLSSFKAKVEDRTVRVSWKSESETNFSHFEVFKSIDGKQFFKIGSVSPSLNREYDFFDGDPNPNNYYKLKLIDLDGSFRYSGIIKAFFNLDKNSLPIIKTSPYSWLIDLKNLAPGKYSIKVVSSLGQIIKHVGISTDKDVLYHLDLPNIGKGMYLLIIDGVNGVIKTIPILTR